MIKKVMLGLVAIAAISSCIKREDSLSTVQSTNVGSATLTGDVFAKTDYVGDTLTNGALDFYKSGVSPIAGVVVVAVYNEGDLDANNVNEEDVVITTTTDANGNYSLSVPANGEGTYVEVYLDYTGNMNITHDCYAMGFNSTGTATSITTSHKFVVDYSYGHTLFNGQLVNKATWLEEANDALWPSGCY